MRVTLLRKISTGFENIKLRWKCRTFSVIRSGTSSRGKFEEVESREKFHWEATPNRINSFEKNNPPFMLEKISMQILSTHFWQLDPQ